MSLFCSEQSPLFVTLSPIPRLNAVNVISITWDCSKLGNIFVRTSKHPQLNQSELGLIRKWICTQYHLPPITTNHPPKFNFHHKEPQVKRCSHLWAGHAFWAAILPSSVPVGKFSASQVELRLATHHTPHPSNWTSRPANNSQPRHLMHYYNWHNMANLPATSMCFRNAVASYDIANLVISQPFQARIWWYKEQSWYTQLIQSWQLTR